MRCHGKVCTLLHDAGIMDRVLSKKLGVSLLSSEFKIVSAIMSESRCVIKDLPSITGLSNRTVYDIIMGMQENGVVNKSRDADDKRFHLVELSVNDFRERICKTIAQGMEVAADCEMSPTES